MSDVTQAFGRDAVEAAQGYEALKRPEETPAALTVSEAAEQIGAERGAAKPEAVQVGEPLNSNVSIRVEDAAEELSALHTIQRDDHEIRADIDLITAVNDLRAPPKLPPLFPEGTPAPEVPPADGEKPAETGKPPTDEAEAKPGDVSAKVKEALEIPEIREAIEQQVGQARQAELAYGEAIENVHGFALAQVLATVPELYGIPPEQLPAALAMLQRTDPQRHAVVSQQIGVAHNLEQRVAAFKEKKAAEDQRVFEGWAAEQDKEFEGQHKAVFANPARAKEVREATIRYLTDVVGIPAGTLPKMWSNHLFRDAKAQRIMHDAAMYHLGAEKARNAVRAPLPPVQRPGTSNGHQRDNSAQIGELSRQLPTLKGKAAIDTAVRMMKLERQGKRR